MNRTTIVMAASLLAIGCNRAPEITAPTENVATAAPEDAAPADGTASEAGKLWVTTQYADRHSCPSEKCGIVGRLFFRDAATPLEEKGDWVRISKLYDAACESGKSKYVDKGNAACAPENGIEDGRIAEWVKASQLAKVRPADPALTANADESIVAQSDDFVQYRAAFAKVAAELIADGRCTAVEFKEQGGWMKSTNQRDQPVYFTYCGGMTIDNKIYMNAETAKVM